MPLAPAATAFLCTRFFTRFSTRCPARLGRRLGALALSVLALMAEPAAAQLVFQTPLPASAGNLALRSHVGDLNEDGLPELVTNHWLFGGPPTVSFGTAPGQFGPAQPFPVVNSGTGVFQLADFDADGHLDLLAMIGPVAFLSVSVLPGRGDGSFDPAVGVNGNFLQPVDADVGDFDGDGALDVAIYNTSSGFSMGSIVATFGNGDGSFGAPIDLHVNTLPFGGRGLIRVGDTNGDGFDDIVFTVTSAGSTVLLSRGDGSFVTPACPGGCGAITDRDFVLADVDGDGRDDAVTNRLVMRAQPDGSFGFTGAEVFDFPTDFVPWSVGVGDLDGDGRLDVVLGRNGNGSEFDPGATLGDVCLLRGNGDLSFQTPGLIVSHVPAPRGVTLTDVDADGRLDVVVAEFQSAPAPSTRVLLNHTYGAGSPFTDLGGALAGSNGFPIQLASGALVAGQPFAFKVQNGPANGSAWHVVGMSRLDAPFKGGVMIPAFNLLNGPFPLSAAGHLTLAGNWPAGGAGLTLYAQFWMPNGGGPAGLVASSGIRAQVP